MVLQPRILFGHFFPLRKKTSLLFLMKIIIFIMVAKCINNLFNYEQKAHGHNPTVSVRVKRKEQRDKRQS